MNEVALCANDVLRNDVMLRINDVALRANGHASSVIWRGTVEMFTNLWYNERKR